MGKMYLLKWCWPNWMSTCRRMKIDPYLSACTNLKSKWFKDLNIKSDTLNMMEERVENKLPEQNTNSSGTKINN